MYDMAVKNRMLPEEKRRLPEWGKGWQKSESISNPKKESRKNVF